MEKAIYGSHNSMTYLRAKNWFFEIFHIFWRCQNKTLQQQFDAGCRCFDFRVRLNPKTLEPEFAHGIVALKSASVYDTLYNLADYAATHKEKVYFRIVLEDRKAYDYNEEWFKNLCEYVEWLNVKYVIPFQGNRKGDWKQVYKFGYKPELVQYVGSMAEDARWYEKIMPWMYAKRCNKENYIKANSDIAIYDFV